MCLEADCVRSVFLEGLYDEAYERPVDVSSFSKPCGRCGDPLIKGDKAMAKRLKKIEFKKRTPKEQLEHEAAFAAKADPTVSESLSYKIMHSKAKLPKGATIAQLVTDPLAIYANFENTPRACRITGKRDDRYVMLFWAYDLGEWLETTVAQNYPLTTDLSGLTPESVPPTEQEAKMAKGNRKHAGAGKPAKEARAVSAKTGCKEGSIGDQVGLAILDNKDADKRLAAIKAVIRASFKAKGKDTDDESVERQSRSWVGYMKKQFPKIYESVLAKPEKVEKKAPAKKAAKKETAKAAA